MDYKDMTKKLVADLGGIDNISETWHCATRLRFILKDESQVADDKISDLDGVITTVKAGGQYQVVIGNNVGDAYDAMLEEFPGLDAGQEPKSQTPAKKETVTVKNIFNGLIAFLSGSFTPFLGTMAGAGILKGLLALLVVVGWLTPKSGAYQLWYAAADGIFYFLPVVLAFTAAKQLKVNQYTTVAISFALVYPNLIQLASTQSKISFFGLGFVPANFASTVIPVMLVVWLQKYLEPLFNKLWHESVRNILVPLCLFMILVPLTFLIVGPINEVFSGAIGSGIEWLYQNARILSGVTLAAFWQVFVIFGVHWAFMPIMLNNLTKFGFDPLTPILLPAVLAQGGSALAFFLAAKNKKMKAFAGSNVFSALFGVTEPTVYGITLKYKKPFYLASIAAAVGGAIVAFSGVHASAVGLVSVLSIPTFISKGIWLSIIGDVVAFVLAAVLTYFFGIPAEVKEEPVVAEAQVSNPTPGAKTKNTSTDISTEIFQPVAGEVIDIKAVNDEVFASEAMGQGIAVIPQNGQVVAPVAGEILVAYPTGHAIGMRSDSGVEILIHIGIDTIELDGKGFKMLVKSGEHVVAGQPLVEFDLDFLITSGYDPTVMMLVTNSADYQVKKNLNTQAHPWVLHTLEK